jgi:hypothetical protein
MVKGEGYKKKKKKLNIPVSQMLKLVREYNKH